MHATPGYLAFATDNSNLSERLQRLYSARIHMNREALMSSAITIYHNPSCSKSRQTLALIEQAGITPNIVEYLQTPPDAETLTALLDKLVELPPRDIMRKAEQAYADNNLADDTLSESALIQAMIAHPILIQRPIVVKGDKAVIGRPPENVLELL